jgi:CRISPR-associated protein Cas2
MMVLVTYDVSTVDSDGRRRLTRVAKTCLDYGQRVQNSVFECSVTPEQWAELRYRLIDKINPQQDSLRFYFLGKHWQQRVEHVGAKAVADLDGPLII